MNPKLPLNQCIGITETADAALHIEEWEQNLKEIPAAILISKCPTEKYLEAVLRNKEKLILHFTITGFAGTILEKNSPKISEVFSKIENLILRGFNPKQIVIRTDPVIPTKIGIARFNTVINSLKELNKRLKDKNIQPVNRVRYSFIDIYPHVEEKLKKNGCYNPYGKGVFSPPKTLVKNFLSNIEKERNLFTFESCAEDTIDKKSCISERDIQILKLNVALVGSANQRKSCSCPQNKIQIIEFNAKSPCPLHCLYCYWKTN